MLCILKSLRIGIATLRGEETEWKPQTLYTNTLHFTLHTLHFTHTLYTYTLKWGRLGRKKKTRRQESIGSVLIYINPEDLDNININEAGGGSTR